MDDLRVALIGAGFMGRAHALAYQSSRIAPDLEARLRPVVIADANGALAEEFSEQFGWPEWSSDWEAVIARDDIDVVDICTPPQFHEAIALAAIEAGKHVFCEKPITNSAGEAVRMARIAATAGVVTQVGFNYRHTPAIGYIRRLLDEKAIGVPLQLRASYLQDTGFGASPDRWRASKKTGGSGTVGDIGSHAIDVGEYLCGDVVRVAARMRSLDQQGGTGWLDEETRLDEDLIDDAGVWLAEFADGAIGSFSVSSFSSGSKNRLAFGLDTTTAAVEFNWNEREVFRISRIDDPADESGFRSVFTNDRHPGGAWRLAGLGAGYVDTSAIQFQKFVGSITTGRKLAPDFADAAHVQQVVEAVTEAATGTSWVDVPAREEIVA